MLQTIHTINYKNAGIVEEDGSDDKILSAHNTDLIVFMSKTIKELTEKNDLLNDKISQLESKQERLVRIQFVVTVCSPVYGLQSQNQAYYLLFNIQFQF